MGFATRLDATSTHRHDVHTCSSDACSGASAIRHTSSTARTRGTKQTRQASVLRVLLAAPPACVDGSSPHAVTAARPPAPDTHPQPRARSPPLCRAARCRRTVADRRGSNRAVSRRAQVARAKGGVEITPVGCGHHGCKAASRMAFCTARAAWRMALAAAQTAAPSSAVK